ncbi:MOSC domain-containing protein [Pseudorhodobacter sp. E13]|uniref:MOSC domain-containing protein n=1 Tax=Pseudorhodobacter sp. E13 TaxID=2487931 RepID=UPI000F8E760C|nr:MOSC domain-containing protein [Pseudorhodobacter sp. E13]RUS63154.1 MOSC domain-containing protein [Pseudorhodobacter sp. E13]
MPALMKTDFMGTIVWLGLVRDRAAQLASAPVDQINALFSGPEGEAHGGLTRPSCSRVLTQYPRGTPIRNTRQFAILCAAELAAIAADMGVETLDPALMGATMVIAGIPDFTHLPPSSRLQAPSGATLVVDMENRPCVLPAKPIEAMHPGKGAAFKPAGKGRRGVTAWVEREGLLRLGDSVTLHIPDQRGWRGLQQGQDPRR